MKKLKYILTILLLLFAFNFIKNILGIEKISNVPNVEINEELVFQDENQNENQNGNQDEKKLNINDVSFEEIVENGFSSKIGYKIIEYRSFVGHIDNLENLVRIKGISKNNLNELKKKFYAQKASSKEYMKHNINYLDEEGLYLLGFSKKEIKNIVYIRELKEIKSELDLKDKVNMDIINKHIIF
ncbi:helix-hairpin-helix domain-containing protein [Streptobacillus moniliformis]|uniref:helix-hairpin-helix domain-containing protein n=1 Tax=Streptobacillus moniliformis TaxID=34105 RepID=UPI0007E44CA0|nr:helix-hairpin-helix domain-containing protein [Streptobacillus moniliformis]